MTKSEVERIREVYKRREGSVDALRYTPFDPAHLLLHHSRQRAFVEVLKSREIHTLQGLKILEVGCGAADILIEYLAFGAKSSDLYGVDLQMGELVLGRMRSPNLRLLCADGCRLPFRSGSFDLVTQYTVLTSILEGNIRQLLASEMVRVLKPDGLIISYDFWPDNPRNSEVRGLKLAELKELFPGSRFEIRKIVLAPPIARRVAPVSSLVAQLMECFPWICTHYMVGISVK